jgi:transposase
MMVNSAGMSSSSTTTFTPRSDTSVITQSRGNARFHCHAILPCIAKCNLVERFFNKLKHFRGVATRYDKNPENYLAGVKLASARIWMRANESMA